MQQATEGEGARREQKVKEEGGSITGRVTMEGAHRMLCAPPLLPPTPFCKGKAALHSFL